MDTKNTSILVIVIAIFIIGAFYLYNFTGNNLSKIPYTNEPVAQQDQDSNSNGDGRMIMNFSEKGYVVMNNPGLDPDVTYLIYEAPGSPALTAELKLTQESSCIFSETEAVSCVSLSAPLHLSLKDKLILVEGYYENGVISVVTIDAISNADLETEEEISN